MRYLPPLAHRRLCVTALFIGPIVATPALAQDVAFKVDDARWGCYDPAPGHPTQAERQAFVQEIGPAAKSEERAGGPPAAGLMAMAALESGFGYTRTALFAQNLFGWKYRGSASAGGRGSWILTCQPPSDPGNRYVHFADKADAVAFVAGKLATLPRYAPVTRQYHADRDHGLSVDASIDRWVHGIAGAGYNPYASYRRKVLSIMRNFRSPGTAGAKDDSLISYSDQ